MKKSETLFGLLRIPTDALAVFAALILSYRLRLFQIDLIPGLQLLEPAQTLPILSEYLSTFVYPGIGAFLLVATFLRLYALKSTWSAWREIERLILAAIVWVVVIMAWYFLVRKQLFYSRILLIHSAFFTAIFVSLMRMSLVYLQREFLRLGIGVRTVVSIGKRRIAHHAHIILQEDMRYKYIGHCSDLKSLKKIAKKKHIDLALQTDPNPSNIDTLDLADYCRNHHIGYAFLPPMFADTPHQLSVERLGLLPMLQFKPTPLDGWGRVCKRLFDFFVSGVLLLLLSPVLLFVAVGIVVSSGFPVFYVSKRVGELGRTSIPVFKFRSMVRDADKKKHLLQHKSHRTDGPLFKIKNDPRVTTFGYFLRRWSIDELPQLVNVFIGDMSLVGPRPHLPSEVKRYAPQERRVFAIKPGITGLAQISGRSDLSFADEVHLDLKYIEEWSLSWDLWILWRTAFVVVQKEGSD
jgi:exopolysaccharide biosynthesis polyprenyl glycosylphosphotransferase